MGRRTPISGGRPPRAGGSWAIALGGTDLTTLYGGRVVGIDAWVVQSEAEVLGAALSSHLRSSGVHLHRLLTAAEHRLGRPRHITMYGLHGHERQLRYWAWRVRVGIGHGLHGREARAAGHALDSLRDSIRAARPQSMRDAARAAAEWTVAYQPPREDPGAALEGGAP